MAATAANARPPFVVAVVRAVSWKMLLTTQLIGVLVALARSLQQRAADVGMTNHLLGYAPRVSPHLFNSHFIVTSVGALCVMLAALAADEGMRRGVRLGYAYLIALVSASCGTAIIQWCLRAWLGVDYAPGSGLPLVRLGLVALDTALLGGLALLAYLNRQSGERMLAGVRGAELERIQVERRLIDSRLATAQAQVDPGSLLRRLGEIRDLYATARAGADGKLETLIRELRTSVTHSAVATDAERAGHS
ncbi:MAG TPA: hypothetical protein VGG67_10185 [Steroidobacteraceae bacterium]|jgi:hypothetical protein